MKKTNQQNDQLATAKRENLALEATIAEMHADRQQTEANHYAALQAVCLELAITKDNLRSARQRAEAAEKATWRALDERTFAEYDRASIASIERAGIAPKHRKRALRELKEFILTLDDADLKKPWRVFDAWARRFAKANPEFTQRQARR